MSVGYDSAVRPRGGDFKKTPRVTCLRSATPRGALEVGRWPRHMLGIAKTHEVLATEKSRSSPGAQTKNYSRQAGLMRDATLCKGPSRTGMEVAMKAVFVLEASGPNGEIYRLELSLIWLSRLFFP